MLGALFRPTLSSRIQTKATNQVRLPGHYAPSPIPPNQNKSSVVISTKSISAPLARPSLTRTQSSPSMTTAPLFPDEIIENLYISDLETARAVLSPNYSSPGRPSVKYVLTLLDNAKDQPQAFFHSTTENGGRSEVVRKLIKLSDYNDVNLLEKLPEACDFIRQSLAKKDGGVLVHCRKGVSRSGSVMVAFLMQELGMNFDDALQRAKKSRSKICPNRSFGEQLKMWKDMNYTLVDETGIEKAEYTQWKAKTRFRPEHFNI